jgi:uncharacterized protein (DUF111 family)
MKIAFFDTIAGISGDMTFGTGLCGVYTAARKNKLPLIEIYKTLDTGISN